MKLSTLTVVAIVLMLPGVLRAQTELNRTFPVQSGQKLNMHFDYPELIRVTTWDRNEISVQGTVDINGGENDEAFQVDVSASGNTIDVNGYIKGLRDLPERITVMRDGQKMIFRNKEEWNKYQNEHGRSYNMISMGPAIDITLEIMVPRNMVTRVESVYGMVEVKNFAAPLTVEATYGGVDAALSEKGTGEVRAETNYGEIFTNLDTKFASEPTNGDFHTYVSARPGNGPRYRFESKYGNVYLRKAGQ